MNPYEISGEAGRECVRVVVLLLEVVRDVLEVDVFVSVVVVKLDVVLNVVVVEFVVLDSVQVLLLLLVVEVEEVRVLRVDVVPVLLVEVNVLEVVAVVVVRLSEVSFSAKAERLSALIKGADRVSRDLSRLRLGSRSLSRTTWSTCSMAGASSKPRVALKHLPHAGGLVRATYSF